MATEVVETYVKELINEIAKLEDTLAQKRKLLRLIKTTEGLANTYKSCTKTYDCAQSINEYLNSHPGQKFNIKELSVITNFALNTIRDIVNNKVHNYPKQFGWTITKNNPDSRGIPGTRYLSVPLPTPVSST